MGATPPLGIIAAMKAGRRALISLIIAGLLAVAAPAGAHGRVCHAQHARTPAPSEEDIELQSYAELRESFGFRHDIPYIKRLIRHRRWDSGSLELPVTKAEDRYLRLRMRLDLGSAALRYLHRHADVDGGVSIEDDWPREPYILVRFTRDVATHLAALKHVARFPENLRAKRIRYSERDRDRVDRRIEADHRALLRAGFFVVSTLPEGALRIEIAVVTRRRDYQAFFAARYGPMVKVRFAGTHRTLLECARAETYTASPDGLTLTAHWGASGSATPDRIELAESADRVELGVVERVPNGPQLANLVQKHLSVRLSAPLGGRAVIDAGSRRRVVQKGPSPGEPACPPAPAVSELELLAHEREREGLPSDPATVRERLAHGGAPIAAEQRWLDRQAALLPNRAVEHYLLVHRDVFGGFMLVGRFPETQRIIYRFTRNVTRHAAAIRRRVRHPAGVRTATVTYTERDLFALDDRIRRDADQEDRFLDGYGRAGFFYVRSEVDIPDGVVRLEIAATRSDAAAYFAARYGPLVRTELVGDRYECADPFAYAGPRTVGALGGR